MTENTLRNGITTIEAVRALDFDECYVIVKNEKDEEVDHYWYRKDCDSLSRCKRYTDNLRVFHISIEQTISLIRFANDPRITIIVRY